MNIDLIEQDKKHRQLALDATQSFIVQAPAGSGKTELLIQRFLLLLSHVKAPEEILAITFTKKAASEMRSRIIKALKQAEEAEPSSDHAKLTWQLARRALQQDAKFGWHLITNPNQLRIQTIDALCTHLTKQLPLLSTFGSQPDIADSPTSLYREAVQEILLHVEENFEWSKAISQLLIHLDNDLNKLHDLMVNLLAKRDQWLPYIHLSASNAEIFNELEHHLELVISERLRKLRHIFPTNLINELLAIAQFAAANLTAEKIESAITICQHMTALPGFTINDQQAWVGIGELLLTNDCGWRKRLDKKIGFPPMADLKNPVEKAAHKAIRERFTALLESLQDREDLRQAFDHVFSLPDPHYQIEQRNILQSILQVLKIAAAQLRIVFQLHGKIDFIENTQAALSALGTDDHPTDLTLALDYQIKHILVDEFQDTSFTQFQLLEKLITGWQPDDGRTLFVVGDPMQSIYRFREAEVGLFIRMQANGIGNVMLTPLKLAQNFRSIAPIVEWNNTHFKQIFPSYTDIATGAVPYTPSVSNYSISEQLDSIKINGYAESDEYIQASQIAAITASIKHNHPTESIAILVRSRSHLSAIIPALKKAKIAYRAVDIDPLASRQCIIDLLSLTSALLHPADRIAWLAILRAPWCGLTLADLLIIAGDNQYHAIWERLNQKTVIQQLSNDGQERLARILPILNSKLAERERENLRYWIETTWILLGGPACLADELELDDCNAFFALLDKFNQQHLTLNIDDLKEKINYLYATSQHDNNAVQIMTIHTAKGLEFDTVILPHLERTMPHDDKPLLTWIEQPLATDKTALLLAPINAIGTPDDRLYQYIQKQQKIKSDNEVDRLFYVATTRAKKRLCLFFNAEFKTNEEVKTGSASFLGKLWPIIKNEQDKIISSVVAETDQQSMHYQRSIRRLSTEWKNPIIQPTNEKLVIHRQQQGFKFKDNTAQVIGIVTHRLMQHIADRGIDWWQSYSEQQQTATIKLQLQRIGVYINNLDDAVIKVNVALQQTLNDQRGKWILQPHEGAKSEFALTVIIEGKPTNIVIDRTFIAEDGTRWIIDYKTATFSHDELDIFIKKEQEKYFAQMQKYKDAMQMLDNRPIRLALYFPAIPAWHEY